MKLLTLTVLLIVFAFANAGKVEKMLLKSDSNVFDNIPESFMFLAEDKDVNLAFSVMMNGEYGQLVLSPVEKMRDLREVIFDFHKNVIYSHSLDENCCEAFDFDFGVDELVPFINEAWRDKKLIVDEPNLKIYNVDPGKEYAKFNVTFEDDKITEVTSTEWEFWDEMHTGVLSDVIAHEMLYPEEFIPYACLTPQACSSSKKKNLFY